MTIEGRPEFQHDWKKDFEQQRKDRLQNSIDEYLQDHEVSPRRAYEEILSCVQDEIDYHRKNLDRSTALKCLLMGHREVDLIDDPELAAKWQFDKIPNRF
jgi:predicted house-cleaning noncanonical NTP pyrophosphatase (MazG superfamily)